MKKKARRHGSASKTVQANAVFAPSSLDDGIESIAAFSRTQIASAGARYTPGVDISAPNITIDSLVVDLNHLRCGPELRDWCQEASITLESQWRSTRSSVRDPESLDHDVSSLVDLIREIPARSLAGDCTCRDSAVTLLDKIDETLRSEESRLHAEEREAARTNESNAQAPPSTELQTNHQDRSIQSSLHELSRMIQATDALQQRIAGSPGKLLANRACLLSGQWGTGKTHFLCDYSAHLLKKNRPALLLLAKNFQGRQKVADAVSSAAKLTRDIDGLLDAMEALGKRLNERALIIIDGINEAPRLAWRNFVDVLIEKLSTRKHLALVVSCRSPFEALSLSATALAAMANIVHTGFDDQEFDAQSEFFRYYGIPLPEVPLLNDEFSRPLTLKLICESFRGLNTRRVRAGFHGVASGQKGMTFVLESFVNRIAEPIEKRHGLPTKSCWQLLKGSRAISDSRISGLAPHMAITLREYVGKRTALRIIRAQHPSLKPLHQRRLLEDMRVNGLLDEDYIWTGSGALSSRVAVFRLPYQRFSDHLVARHLLDKHLDKSNVAAVRASFSGRRPLGRVFWKRSNYHDYSRPGWAEALIVEFPEAVKRVSPDTRELYFFLPTRSNSLATYFKPFVQGLFWRAPTSFSKGTGRIVKALLDGGSNHVWESTIDALVATSIKPDHPYSADRLYRYLSGFDMSSRDRKWTEYVRRQYASPSIRRLFTWMKRAGDAPLPANVAKQLVTLLSLTLTTVARADRDLATRALVELGQHHPSVLFQRTLTTLKFNDPYVRERMLAASYGVAMVRHSVRPGLRFQRTLALFARSIYEEMFSPNASHSTHHALQRDYALGIIRLALSSSPHVLTPAERDPLAPPFRDIPSIFPEPNEITDDQCSDGESAIRMDFGNYTIGRLIPGRGNYDYNNADYKAVLRQIQWRIWHLGYRKDDFQSIERQVSSMSYYAEQNQESPIDRYGKKYSWIAYFEMYGLREAQGKLSKYVTFERTSDCDIDPSFPIPPREWSPSVGPTLGDSQTDTITWMTCESTPDFRRVLRQKSVDRYAGAWVLLQGFLEQENAELDRESFCFFRGLLLRRKDVPALRDKFHEIEYPGNSAIPDGPEDHCLYAGEVGTSPRYARDLLRPNGQYKRHMEEAFSSTEHIPTPKGMAPRNNHVEVIIKGLRAPGAAAQEDDSEPAGTTLFKLAVANPGEWRHVHGVRVEIPYRQFAWSSSHSKENEFCSFYTPAASIISRFNLRLRNREVDFREPSGGVATLYRKKDGKDLNGETSMMLYIREDLLKRYLRQTRQTLVWCVWGERRPTPREYGYDHLTPELSGIFQTHANIYRVFYEHDQI